MDPVPVPDRPASPDESRQIPNGYDVICALPRKEADVLISDASTYPSVLDPKRSHLEYLTDQFIEKGGLKLMQRPAALRDFLTCFEQMLESAGESDYARELWQDMQR